MVCSINGCGSAVLARALCCAHYQRMRKYGDPLGGHKFNWDLFDELAAIETDECVIWPKSITSAGYGHFYERGGRHVITHREALARRQPSPFPTAVTRHGPCHNRACMNYRHLSWGTQVDNAMDRVRDDSHNRGDRHGNSKLTIGDALAIKTSTEHREVLAVRFGVRPTHVDSIRFGRSWSWLEVSV